MPAVKTSLFKWQQLGNDTQEEVLKAMERKRTKTEHMEIVLKGPRKACGREKMCAASNTISTRKIKGKEENPVLTPKREEIQRTQRYQSVRKAKQAGTPLFQWCNAKRNPHATVGTHPNAHATNPKLYSSTKAKMVKTKLVLQLLP